MYALYIAVTMVIVELPAIAVRVAPFRGIMTKRQKFIASALYAIILSINFAVCWWFASHNLVDINFYKLKLIACGAILLIVNLLVIPNHLLEHLFTCGVEATISTIMPVLVAFVGYYLPPFDEQMAVSLNAVFYTLIYAFIYPPVSRLVCACVEPFLDLQTEGYWGTICMIPMFLFLGNLMTYPSNTFITTPLQFFGQLMIIAAVIMMCLSVAKDPARMRSRNMMARSLEFQKQYFASMTEQIERARRELHDAKYRVTTIEHYIEMNDKEGLVEYCKTMIPKRYYSVELFRSGNSAVDGILFHYSQRAEAANVDFKIAGTVTGCTIPDDEMSVLLGNAMENAFTGCMTVQKNRFVTFVAQPEPHVLSLMIRNSFDGMVKVKKGELQSRKRTQGSGYGISSMEMICKKHGGTMEVQWDDETFTVLIILPMDAE